MRSVPFGVPTPAGRHRSLRRTEPRRGSGLQPRRGHAAASPGNPAVPPVSRPGPHRGPVRSGDPSLPRHPTEPLLGSRPTDTGDAPRPREALAALGIPGLQAASPLGLAMPSSGRATRPSQHASGRKTRRPRHSGATPGLQDPRPISVSSAVPDRLPRPDTLRSSPHALSAFSPWLRCLCRPQP